MIKEPQRVTQSPPCAQKNSLNNYTKQRNPSKRGKTIEIEDAQKKFSYNSSFFTQYNKKRRKTHHSTKSNATTWHSWKCIFHFFFWFFLLLGFLKNPKRKHKRKWKQQQLNSEWKRAYWLEDLWGGFAVAEAGGRDEADFCLGEFLAFFFAIFSLPRTLKGPLILVSAAALHSWFGYHSVRGWKNKRKTWSGDQYASV